MTKKFTFSNEAMQKAVSDVMDSFDFADTQRIMEASKWYYYDDHNHAPTIQRLREVARDLLEEVVRTDKSSLATGGFFACRVENQLSLFWGKYRQVQIEGA